MKTLRLTRRAWLVSMALCALCSVCPAQDKAPSAGVPEARHDQEWWMKLHQSFLDRAKKKDVDVLFLGDSITQGWGDNATWKRHYAPRSAANFGIGGDRTQHVLWRLEHGEIEGINPRVAVLMIGTNNIGANSPAEIAEGVKLIVAKLREKLPMTKILVLGVFPRGKMITRDYIQAHDDAPVDPRTREINASLAKLDDGKMVKYLDIEKSFLKADGAIPKALMPDFLHLSDSGYRTWADAIEPTLWELMQ
ncbi:MAG: lysophospholipase L1-like esterase [Planctomycetota bacterium]|nr:lysophospholipase L1-like esterase [Planctomycetota bacterium]